MDKEKMKEFGAAMAGGPLGYMAYKNKDKIKEKGKVIISAAANVKEKFKSKMSPEAKQAFGEFKKTGQEMKGVGVATANTLDRIARKHTPAGVIGSGVGLIKDKLAERKSNKTRAEVNEKAAESLKRKIKYKLDHIVPLKDGGTNSSSNLRVLPKILKK